MKIRRQLESPTTSIDLYDNSKSKEKKRNEEGNQPNETKDAGKKDESPDIKFDVLRSGSMVHSMLAVPTPALFEKVNDSIEVEQYEKRKKKAEKMEEFKKKLQEEYERRV